MAQVIVVQYQESTGKQGSRWAATSGVWRISTPYDHELSADENAKSAARALCTKAGWTFDKFVWGKLPNGDRVFVFAG